MIVLKVTSLKYKKENGYLLKVLDIKDDEVAEKTLPTEIEVTDLTFNQYPGYLLHHSHLSTVELSSGSSS